MTIWGNTIVKNEDRYIWFAIKSVIDYLDKILIWDTGSDDDTVSIIKLLQKQYPKKIEFKEIGSVDAASMTQLRQKMLDGTKSDWFIIIDGDEIWWEKSMREILEVINTKGDGLNAIVTPVINLIGDIYHFQEEEAGKYKILGKTGHFNIRAINRKILGLHVKNTYPLEGYYDGNENLIQETSNLVFQNNPLLHFTHLNRSTKGKSKKIKYEVGMPFAADFKYPEVLYLPRPDKVANPWTKMSLKFKLRAALQTPLKKVKRRLYRI